MEFTLSLPPWAVIENELLHTQNDGIFPTVEERMSIVVRFARLNIENNTGGPFASAVFERNTGKFIVAGVNRVVDSLCSSAHAEIVTLSLAQKLLGTYDLGGHGQPAHQLVVNWLPCAMCFGGLVWSGIRSLVIAGSDERLEQITGFDEGPRTPYWREELAKRRIEVIEDILTEDALAVYKEFAASGACVYNSRQGGSA